MPMMFPMNWFMLSFFILLIPHVPYNKLANMENQNMVCVNYIVPNKKWDW